MANTPPMIHLFSVLIAVEEQHSDYPELRYCATASTEGIKACTASAGTIEWAKAEALRLVAEALEQQAPVDPLADKSTGASSPT
jgi:hypothetical protein